MDADFKAALDRFVAGAQALIDAEYQDLRFRPTLKIDPKGRRYIRLFIQRGDDEGRSCWGFIVAEDVATNGLNFVRGDVAKSAGWSGPAKHARGNIFDASGGLKHVSAYGPVYLKN